MKDGGQLSRRTGQVETSTSCEFCPGQLRSVQKLIQITLLSHRFKTGRRIKLFGVLGTMYLLQGISQNQEKETYQAGLLSDTSIPSLSIYDCLS
jgi:hypothetical protein